MILLAHLWQSTVCAGLAALLAASLAHASARVRHRIWLCASIKFLMPFSLLAMAGGVAGTWLPSAGAPLDSVAVRWLDQTRPFWSLAALQRSSGGVGFDANRMVALGLFVWGAGAAAMVWWRWRTWRALDVLARAASPLEHGREADALRRVSRRWPPTRQIALLACQTTVGPGVHGVWRPQVLWPIGLSDRLSDEELDAILAHEVCHVHHRDTAVALLQMLVETLLWFHPVVWWLGARLVTERERACDEEVLRMGADNRNYAEGILKVCGFCLGSPIECGVGIGRSALAQRVVRIMQHQPSPRLGTSTRALLGGVGVLLVAAPLLTGLLEAQRRSIDVPDRSAPSWTATGPQRAAGSRAAGQETVYRPSRAIVNPKVIKEAKPGYTADAMRAGIQGGVLLEAVVLRDGTVGEVTVTRSLDNVHGLDKQAVQAVKQWRFQPGTKDGTPVAVRVEIEMTFTLKKS